jgi:hypothetical protein
LDGKSVFARIAQAFAGYFGVGLGFVALFLAL